MIVLPTLVIETHQSHEKFPSDSEARAIFRKMLLPTGEMIRENRVYLDTSSGYNVFDNLNMFVEYPTYLLCNYVYNYMYICIYIYIYTRIYISIYFMYVFYSYIYI